MKENCKSLKFNASFRYPSIFLLQPKDSYAEVSGIACLQFLLDTLFPGGITKAEPQYKFIVPSHLSGMGAGTIEEFFPMEEFLNPLSGQKIIVERGSKKQRGGLAKVLFLDWENINRDFLRHVLSIEK